MTMARAQLVDVSITRWESGMPPVDVKARTKSAPPAAEDGTIIHAKANANNGQLNTDN